MGEVGLAHHFRDEHHLSILAERHGAAMLRMDLRMDGRGRLRLCRSRV